VLVLGATLALRRHFSATEFWADTRKYDVNVFVYIGELCRYLVNQPETANDINHSVRAMAGVGMRPDVWRVFKKRFGIKDVHEMYGATEGAGGIFNLTGRIGMIGRKAKKQALLRCDLATGEIKRNANGFYDKVEVGETGLLIAFIDKNSPYDGYVDKEASQKKLLHGVFKKGDCYFNTGDLITLHDDDWLSFTDRVGDTFRWKGENVSTNEVAEALNVCKGIDESNVYGVDVPGNEGKAGMASLNVKPNFDIKELETIVGRSLASYQRPYFIRLQKEMRTTTTFKHQKVDYQKEGYNPSLIDDELYVLQQGRYIPLDADLFDGIKSGSIDLR